jgi:hypothetical protein
MFVCPHISSHGPVDGFDKLLFGCYVPGDHLVIVGFIS